MRETINVASRSSTISDQINRIISLLPFATFVKYSTIQKSADIPWKWFIQFGLIMVVKFCQIPANVLILECRPAAASLRAKTTKQIGFHEKKISQE